MTPDNPKKITSPCGIYCKACPRYRDDKSCRGCRVDARHNNCDIYDCCVTIGGMDFCHQCEYFPCERLKKFIAFNPGKFFAHFRHIAIENLKRIRDIGHVTWAKEMHKRALSGEYTIHKKNDDGTLDMSPCSCQEKKSEE
jgi:hypothetical protein